MNAAPDKPLRERVGECVVILNPAARTGGGARLAPEISRELSARGVQHRTERTEGAGHAAHLARAAAEAGVGAVIAAGGDGTVHEVVGGLLASVHPHTPFGLIPMGRGNDFAKVIGIRSRREAYDAIAAASVRAIDVGRVAWDGGEEHFVNGMGTGVDVEVVRQIEHARNVPARLVYMVGLARALARYRALPLRVSFGEAHLQGRIMMAAITNGSCIGGGFKVSPGARPDDGLLDLCFVEEVNALSAIVLATRVLAARHAGARAVTMQRAPAFTLEADAPMFFQVDGELREPEHVFRLHVTSVPGALRVLA